MPCDENSPLCSLQIDIPKLTVLSRIVAQNIGDTLAIGAPLHSLGSTTRQTAFGEDVSNGQLPGWPVLWCHRGSRGLLRMQAEGAHK